MSLDNEPIQRGHIFGIAESFGFDPNRVSEIVITPSFVHITVIEGRSIITHEIPVIRP